MHSDWYFEGYKAFFAHKAKDECPYDEVSEPYSEWFLGWNAALIEQEQYEKDISVFSK